MSVIAPDNAISKAQCATLLRYYANVVCYAHPSSPPQLKKRTRFILDDEQKNDYTAVDGLIAKMKLTAVEYETLCAYMAGLTYLEVTRLLNVNRTTIWRRRMNLQRKYVLTINNL